MFHYFPTISWLAGFSVNPCHLTSCPKSPRRAVADREAICRQNGEVEPGALSGVADLAFSSRIPHTVDGSEIQRLPVEGKVV